MPDDNLFPDGNDPNEQEAQAATDTPDTDTATRDAQPPPPADPGRQPSPNDEGIAQLNQVLTQMNERLQALEGKGETKETPVPNESDASDPFTKLASDPEGYIRGLANQEAQKLAPAVERALNTISSVGVDRAKNDMETRFPGLWDEAIAPDLTAALEKLPPEAKANPDYVQALTSGILGGLLQSEEGYKKLGEAAARAREANKPAPPPVMLNGNRPPPPREALDRDEKTFIGELERSGIPFDSKRYLSARNRGRSEEDWGATWMADPTTTKEGN